jgi:hypothetical protein
LLANSGCWLVVGGLELILQIIGDWLVVLFIKLATKVKVF